MLYNPGDVVLCNFPLREDPTQFTFRPALVISCNNDEESYRLAQITTTDRRGQLKGYWVEKNSKVNKSMHLLHDSFISMSNILTVQEYAISRLVGKCPIMDELLKMI